jgi:hypothetical protein
LIPALSRLSVSVSPGHRLRRRCSSRYLRISLLHLEFHDPLKHSRHGVSTAIPRLSPGLSQSTFMPAYAPFTPNDSEQRSHPTYYRGCWHVVSRCFFFRYRQMYRLFASTPFTPIERALRPEGLLHSRGVAASGFRPLRKIPHCCLP